ncbi:hypothetical protein ACKWTF_015089 [Chironomus riparius]
MSQNHPRDSQWLQLDVCLDFLVGKCGKLGDCQFAHPMTHVDVVDNKVMACYDSFKGRCRRVTPPCKYYHPTPPLMEVLVQRGKNHIAMKNSIQFPQLISDVSAMQQQQQFVEVPTTSKSQKIEIGSKRSANVVNNELPIEMMYFKRPTLGPATMAMPMIQVPFIPQPVYQPSMPVVPTDPNGVIPLNAPFVTYTDINGQILDNLPVCQDFNRNMCTRINCKFVHLLDPKKLEIHEHRVAVCRDHANGICRRQQCKYYHIPIQLPPATHMLSSIHGP